MNKWAILSLLLGCLAFSSCTDDIASPSAEGWTVRLDGDDEQAVLPSLASYESVKVAVDGKDAHEFVLVTCSDPWLKLNTDTLPDDGIVAVETETNDENARREATLTFASTTNPQHVATLTITQMSSADNDNNSDPVAQMYIGYGYDIYKSTDNPMSVRTKEPILDLAALQRYSSPNSYEVIHDSKIARMDMKYYTAYTLYQFSTELTQSSSEGSRNITGSLEDCKDAMSYCKKTEFKEQNFGRGTVIKTVASRVMDRGALDDLRRTESMQFTFSKGFKRAYEELKMKSGAARTEAIKNLLAEYGTHVVIQADLGGRIDYTFTMDKSATTNNEAEMKEEIDFTFGTMPASDRNVNFNHTVSSRKSASGALKIKGGSRAAREQLQRETTGLETSGHLAAESVTAWLASINYDASAARQENLDVVHFELMPVWDLVESSLHDEFLNATMDMMSRSDYKLPSEMLSGALYQLDMTRSYLTNFSTASNTSLCKTVYLNNGMEMTPVMEVCQEYVPAIRTDKRVTIVYPIYNNRIRITQGIFLGDDIYPASKVAFSGTKAVVVPLTLKDNKRKVETLYYINGNFSTESSGLKFFADSERNLKVRDDMLILKTTDGDSEVHKHPIVKIGNMFWTRENINHNMNFTNDDPKDRDAAIKDLFVDGESMLYTRFQYDSDFWFNSFNKWTYGYSPVVGVTGKPNTKWYLPTPEMLSNLYAYLGFNPKALFKGQVSGFNAQFSGCMGLVDVLNPNSRYTDGKNGLRYNNKLCIIASKNVDGDRTPNLLLLSTDYQWQKVEIKGANESLLENYYPVRLCRGAYYNFHSLEKINEEEENI